MGFEHQELAQKILDQITMHPETHKQSTWTSGNGCGTTHCIAGWAAVLTEGLVKKDYFAYPVPASYDPSVDGDSGDAYMRVGRESLGLTKEDSAKLFLWTNNTRAVMALKYLANGEPIDWDIVCGEDEQ